MGGSLIQLVLYALAGCIVGAIIGWSLQIAIARRRGAERITDVRAQLGQVTNHRDGLARRIANSQSEIERLQAANATYRSKLTSLVKKAKLLAKNVQTLRTERENTKIKLSTIQNTLVSLRSRSVALQTEFDKTREFYKRELIKSLEKRKVLEKEITEARAEQESFAKAVESSVLEHGSEENMVVAAQLRLGQLQVLERNVNKLESENSQLRRDALQVKQEFEARERDLAELDELRLHNKQLVQCVEALEGSRQEYEADAERYREQADHSEKESDTLRLKLEDLEKNFADIEKQQQGALEEARNEVVVPILRKQS